MTLFLLTLLTLGFTNPPHTPSWQPQVSGTSSGLRGVCAVSAKVAWASGEHGTVLRTVDGGATWQKLSVQGGGELDFRDIHAFDAREAFVLSIGPGALSRIYRTADGGRSWRLQFTNPDSKAFYDGFAFWDRKHGIAVSDSVNGKFPLLATDDGENWRPLQPDTLPAALPEEGCFAASGTSIAVGGKTDAWFVTGGPAARIFHSDDSGMNWTVVQSPILSGAASQGAFSVAFRDNHIGVIVGGDYEKPNGADRIAAWSQDGGKRWAPAATGPRGFRSAVAFVPGSSPLVWVAVGTNGSDCSMDDGNLWRPLDSASYNAVSFAPSGDGWVVGPKGVVARWKSHRRRECRLRVVLDIVDRLLVGLDSVLHMMNRGLAPSERLHVVLLKLYVA